MRSLDLEDEKTVVETSSGPRVGFQRLELARFRNYRELSLALAPGFNVFAGANAQGKTNLLEAIYLLSTTRLLRGMRDHEAIMEGHDRALVTGDLVDSGTRLGITLERGVRKRATLNGMALPRAADIIGRAPSVCISTLDLSIVKGEPSERRLFLDIELSQLYPSYLRDLAHYRRALEQRNSLLRAAQERALPPDVFEPWEQQMATHGAALRDTRLRFVRDVQEVARRLHGSLSDGETLSLSYLPKDDSAGSEGLLEALQRHRPSDVARGSTQIGPHRDDLQILIDDREGRLFGSQGQQRTAVIAIKLATLEHATEELGVAPILLLDDILSDLDERRRAHLTEVVLHAAGQAVLTCTESSAAGADILRLARVFKVVAGTVDEA
ncbi:MAG TPA: DNA replication/repair protein RecF [Fimbriimonadaceae bacterium]|nr:DNA replication/repair protein RecF [Fimbriimonadaceae bacterium]